MSPHADRVLDEIEAALAAAEEALPTLKRTVTQRAPAAAPSSPRRSLAEMLSDATAPFTGASTGYTRPR